MAILNSCKIFHKMLFLIFLPVKCIRKIEIVHQIYGHSLFFMFNYWDWFPERNLAASRNSSLKSD